MNNKETSKCCEKCHIKDCNHDPYYCNASIKEYCNALIHETKGEGNVTPKWQIEAKYRGILQVVLAANDWESKYPLLEKMIDGLLLHREEELVGAVERLRIKGTEGFSSSWHRENAVGYNQAIDDLLTLIKNK